MFQLYVDPVATLLLLHALVNCFLDTNLREREKGKATCEGGGQIIALIYRLLLETRKVPFLA